MSGFQRWLAIGSLAATFVITGCAGGAASGSMTPQQREAFELRQYCASHTTDQERCGVFFSAPG